MRQNLTICGEQVSFPRHNSNDEIEDECSANIDWLAYPFLVLPVKKDIPDALDGCPECTWHGTTGEHSRLPDRLIKDRRPTISNKMEYPPSPWIEDHGLLNRHEQKHPSIGFPARHDAPP
jgi:hypothetical protein